MANVKKIVYVSATEHDQFRQQRLHKAPEPTFRNYDPNVIMSDDNLSDASKLKLMQQSMEKFVNATKMQTVRPVQGTTETDRDTLPLILDLIALDLRIKAKHFLSALRLTGRIRWLEDGTLVVDESPIKYSNIADLTHYMVTWPIAPRMAKPTGLDDLKNAIAGTNMALHVIANANVRKQIMVKREPPVIAQPAPDLSLLASDEYIDIVDVNSTPARRSRRRTVTWNPYRR